MKLLDICERLVFVSVQEGPFVVISLLGTVKDSNSVLALMCKYVF